MKSLKFFFTCTFLLSALVLITDCNGNVEDGNSSTLPETKWTIETVSPIGTEGTYPSLAIDNNGNPHISYLDLNDGYLKYAYKNGTTWTIENVGYVANSNGTIANAGLSSIALDAANNPHICYFDFGSGHFKYAKKTGGSWTTTIIPLPVFYTYPDGTTISYIPWAESSIAVDKTTGTAYISLQMFGNGYVLGYWKPGLASAIVVDKQATTEDGSNGLGFNNAIALDGNGFPGISYEDRGSDWWGVVHTPGTLKYAHWNGSAFNLETVAPMLESYWEDRLTSLAIDKYNNPHIAYSSYNEGYKCAFKNGSSPWTIETMMFNQTTPYLSGYPSLSLSLDGTGKPHIALVVDFGNAYRLKHAYWNGSSWSFDTIEDDVGHCAIAVNNSSKIHIVYNTDITGAIKYATK